MKSILLAALASASAASASRLYAASYDGIVSTLSLPPGNNTTGQLSVTSQSKACGPSPSWLTLDRHHDILYCLDEGVHAPNGSVTSFHTQPDGSLTPINHVETIPGPVMSVLYSASGVPGRRFMAVAHYSGSAVTTYSIDPAHGLFSPVQNFTFHMDAPGPNASRQDAPHPHGAYVDPSGRYVLVPDLGADLIRVFAIDQQSGGLEPVQPFVTEPGLGPRHVAFWLPRGGAVSAGNDGDEVYMYLVSELTNTVTGFRVGYSPAGMSFTMVYKEGTFGQDRPGPKGSKASAITVSPQNTHLIISNRLDHTFGSDNDSFAIFSIANANGSAFAAPSFRGLRPAYGTNPRQFDISGAGAGAGGGQHRLVAAAMQDSHEVVVARWDVCGQAPGALYAKLGLEGEVPAVVWDY